MRDYSLIGKNKYETRISRFHDEVFVDRTFGAIENPFAKEWDSLLLPYGLDRNTDLHLNSFERGAHRCGDRRFYLVDAESLEPEPECYGIAVETLEPKTFREAIRDELTYKFLHLDGHLFGRSTDWGIRSAASLDHVMYVGGAPKFMDVIYSDLGDPETLEREFCKWLESTYGLEQEVKERVARTVGWTLD